jgi:hypothetical protein
MEWRSFILMLMGVRVYEMIVCDCSIVNDVQGPRSELVGSPLVAHDYSGEIAWAITPVSS